MLEFPCQDKGASRQFHRTHWVKGDLFQLFFLLFDALALLVHNGVALALRFHRLFQQCLVDLVLRDAAQPLRQLFGECVRLKIQVAFGVLLVLLVNPIRRAIGIGEVLLPRSFK